MPSQLEVDWNNTVSRNQQKETREIRSIQRAMKDEMNEALRGASSTKERREIKKQFKIDTNKASSQTENQTDVNQDSNQRGDDSFKPSYYEMSDGGGGGIPGGFAEETLDVVDAQNAAGQRVFLTKEVEAV